MAKGFQHFAQFTLTQTGFMTAADELKGLADELHFADAAGTEFYVLVLAFSFHLSGDHRFHFP